MDGKAVEALHKVLWGFGVIGVGFVLGAILLAWLARNRTMNVQERRAWFTLGIIGLVAVGYGFLAGVMRFPWFASTGMFGVFGLLGLTGVIGRGERRAGLVVSDERDRDIDRRSTLAGYSVFWLAFVLACMAPFFIKGPNASVTLPTVVLTTPVYIGMMIVFTVKALVTVILYRRGGDGEAN